MFLIIFLIYLLICLIGVKFDKDNIKSDDFLSRNTTLAINGIFVLIVFFSHFNSYMNFTNKFDLLYMDLVTNKLAQLMVCTFLFFSGYGIYESIKKKPKYMDGFFKNRFLKLFLQFAVIILLYILLNVILGREQTILKILLSFIGYESIGNSNWYVFAIFYLYFATMLAFKICKKKTFDGITIIFILSFVYIILIDHLKGYVHWYNTIFCFPAGMVFSHFKKGIIKNMSDNKSYLITFALLCISFVFGYKLRFNYMVYEFFSIIFVLLIIFVSMKFKIGNKVLLFLGKHTFNVYATQRIFFILFKEVGLLENNVYLYFFVCLGCTLLLSHLLSILYKHLFKALKMT